FRQLHRCRTSREPHVASKHDSPDAQGANKRPRTMFHLRISSRFGLFTRPEMKVERYSYDVITPSAARGILEAIYWKPQI
ncbi:CRISPR-associated protein Cas5, partial [Salinicoccus roseus]|uniref:CRISPR-associated protein Cas5 n=1 Tax=Salinicoccus roseus TaxID=45670 RepID=UPI0035646ED3